jgi:hypothetical protein
MSKNLVEPERSQMTLWRRSSCWISKATRAKAWTSSRALIPTHTYTYTHAHVHPHTYTHTHTNVYYWLLFHGKSGFANAPQYYVIRTLPLLLFLHFFFWLLFSRLLFSVYFFSFILALCLSSEVQPSYRQVAPNLSEMELATALRNEQSAVSNQRGG